MPTLKRSDWMAECDVCHARFDPVYGGVCDNCRRLLCGRHFHGGLFGRLRSYVTGQRLCAECRRRAS